MKAKRTAITAEQKIYDKCDRLYPQLRHGRCCLACLAAWRVRPADVIHHVIRRANPITRFELLNFIPLCNECHQKIHDGKLHEPISQEQMEWLVRLSNKSLKGICIARGITKAEYFQEQYNKIKENILI